jgi:hypothetical protein
MGREARSVPIGTLVVAEAQTDGVAAAPNHHTFESADGAYRLIVASLVWKGGVLVTRSVARARFNEKLCPPSELFESSAASRDGIRFAGRAHTEN